MAFGQNKSRRGPKALFLLILMAVAGGAALSFSDVKRYVRMRTM